MKVKCIGNSPSALESEIARAAYKRNVHQEEVELIEGKTYQVYGLVFQDHDGEPWYLVCEDDDDEYPTPHLGAFFSVVDPSIPPGWAIAYGGNMGHVAVLPRPWAEDPYFMEKLVEGESQAVSFFAELRRREL